MDRKISDGNCSDSLHYPTWPPVMSENQVRSDNAPPKISLMNNGLLCWIAKCGSSATTKGFRTSPSTIDPNRAVRRLQSCFDRAIVRR
jgi:hypothetical protein